MRVTLELLHFAQDPLIAALGKEPQPETHLSPTQISAENDLNMSGRIKKQAVPKHFVCVLHMCLK